MVKDPARHRLVFVVSHPLSHSGLWALDTQTEKIRRLRPPSITSTGSAATAAGRVLLGLGQRRLQPVVCGGVRSGPRSAGTDLLQPGRGGRRWSEARQADDRGPRLAGGAALSPRGRRLWTGWPFGRVERGQPGGVAFPPLEDKPELLRGLAGLDHDFNWRTAEPLEDGSVLVSDRYGIWLVTP